MGQEEDDWLEAVSASDCVSTGRGVSSPLWHCVPLAHLAGDICLSSAFLHNITLATITCPQSLWKISGIPGKTKIFCYIENTMPSKQTMTDTTRERKNLLQNNNT